VSDFDIVVLGGGPGGYAAALYAASAGQKVALIEKQGAEVRHLGADLDEAKAAARAYADESGAFFFEDGAEPAQFAGYEAIGDELLDDVPEPASVVVPVGNGALAIGVFRAVARRAPNAERIAVSAAGAPAMWESWRAGGPVDSDRSATFAMSRESPTKTSSIALLSASISTSSGSASSGGVKRA